MERTRVKLNILWHCTWICAICLFGIWLLHFDIKEKNLYAEVGTDMNYILNEENIQKYIDFGRPMLGNLTIDATHVIEYKAGTYPIYVMNNMTGQVLELTLTLTDLDPPKVTWKEDGLDLHVYDSVTPGCFINEASDESGIGVIYFNIDGERKTSYQFTQSGTYDLLVAVRDNNNQLTERMFSVKID